MNEKDFYGVDLVWCIDGTKTPMMETILNVIKNNTYHFWHNYVNAMEMENKDVGSIRVKVIVFRDYKHQLEGIIESEFFKMPHEEQLLVQFVKDIKLVEGDINANYALEAFATALKSKWSNEEKRNRHIVVVFSDKEAYPLNINKDLTNYPKDMPKDLAHLGDWWEGTDQTMGGTYKPKAGRLAAFVPYAYPWNEITAWNRYWPTFITDRNREFSFEEVINILTGSF